MDYKKMVKELSDLFIYQCKNHDTMPTAKDIYGICIYMDESAYCVSYQTLDGFQNALEKCDKKYLEGAEKFDGLKYLGSYGLSYWDVDDCEVNFDSIEKSQELSDTFECIEKITFEECDIDEQESIDWDEFDLAIPRTEFPKDITKFLIDLVTDAINETKDKLDFLDLTDDFVMFMYPLDYGEDEVFENILPLTVDSELIKKKQAL